MPKKRPKRKRLPAKNNAFRRSLLRAAAAVGILATLVVVALILVRLAAPPQPDIAPQRPAKPAPRATTTPPSRPVQAPVPEFEIFPEKEPPTEKPEGPPSVALPKVAIIIDDLGYDSKMAEKFIRLKVPLTIAILPNSPQQKKIGRLARETGVETMLHLPMEPNEYPRVNPGPGTLLTSMTPDELINQLKSDLDAVPDIKGVNNHMGSKLTAASSQMRQVFSVLKERGLFFIDSRTTVDTVCRSSARLFQLPFAQRDVFLDHEQDPAFIRKQIHELIRIAQHRGSAVGIGHPHRTTYRVLQEMLPDLQKKVRLVPASEIVQVSG